MPLTIIIHKRGFLQARIEGYTFMLPDEPGSKRLEPVIKVVLSESSEGLKSGIAPATENSPEVVRPRLDMGRASTNESEFRSVSEKFVRKSSVSEKFGENRKAKLSRDIESNDRRPIII